MTEHKDHLPLYGPGPAYVATILLITAAAIALSRMGILPTGNAGAAAVPLGVLGAAFVAGGIALWAAAVFGAKIDDGILENRLVTTGAYALVRNPIYTAFALTCTGVLLMCKNLWLLVLPPVFWVFMTVLLKATEERWLRDRYGKEYEDYCRQTNRCVPWIARKG